MSKKYRTGTSAGSGTEKPAGEENKAGEGQQEAPTEEKPDIKDRDFEKGVCSADVVSSSGGNSDEAVELLKEIKKNTSRTFIMQCVSSGCMVGILAALLFTVFSLLPMVMKTLGMVTDTITTVSDTLNTVNDLAVEADGAIKEINTMSRSITATSEQISGVVEENTATLSDAVTKINNIDFEGLNKAIKDLEDAVGPFATEANSLKNFSIFGR